MAVVFDIDGTIADISHRLHHILKKPKDWEAFYDGIIDDKPIHEIIDILKTFYDKGHTILLLSGRDRGYRLSTELWLLRYDIPYHDLFMRNEGDRRPDYVIKLEIMENLIIPKYGKPKIIFEDRKRVIDMWEENGYFVVDVTGGQGDY